MSEVLSEETVRFRNQSRSMSLEHTVGPPLRPTVPGQSRPAGPAGPAGPLLERNMSRSFPQGKPKPRSKPTEDQEAPTDDTQLLRGIGRGAQVWTTYVKETNMLDDDMVDGWNRSLDVTLVFAALFSAILTAFVLDSVKSLKPDTSDATVQTLMEISQVLRGIASGQLVEQPDTANRTEFQPRSRAIWVNSLWFLSLSLSVAVSLAAMLAKQWCYYFLSGRTGDAITQAEERQKRYTGIAEWKMRGILETLPVLMHLSLAFFSVGLVLYLQEINVAVASTVSVVAVATLCFYAVTTFLPVRFSTCPFKTPQAVYMRAALDIISKRGLSPSDPSSSQQTDPSTIVEAPGSTNTGIMYQLRRSLKSIAALLGRATRLLGSVLRFKRRVDSEAGIDVRTRSPDVESQRETGSNSSSSTQDETTEAGPWVIGSLLWLITHSQNLDSIDIAIGALAIGKVRFETESQVQTDLKERINSHLVKHFSDCFKSSKEHGVKLRLHDDRTHSASALDYSRWMTYYASLNTRGISEQILALYNRLGVEQITHLGLAFSSVAENKDLLHEDSTNIATWLVAFLDHYDQEKIYFSEQVVAALIDGLTAVSLKMSINHLALDKHAKFLGIPQLIKILWSVSHIHNSQLRFSVSLNLAVFALRAKICYPFRDGPNGVDIEPSHLLAKYHPENPFLKQSEFAPLVVFSLLGFLHPSNSRYLKFTDQTLYIAAMLIRETWFFFPDDDDGGFKFPDIVSPELFPRHMASMLVEIVISDSPVGHGPPDRSADRISAIRELQLASFGVIDLHSLPTDGEYWGTNTFPSKLHAICHLIYDHLHNRISLGSDIFVAATEFLLHEIEGLSELDTTILDVGVGIGLGSPKDERTHSTPGEPSIQQSAEVVASSILELILSTAGDKQCIETAVRAALLHTTGCGVDLVMKAVDWFASRAPAFETAQVNQDQLLRISGYTRIFTSMIMHCSGLDDLTERLHSSFADPDDGSPNSTLVIIEKFLSKLADTRDDAHARAFGIAGLAVWKLQAASSPNNHSEFIPDGQLTQAWELLATLSTSKPRPEALEALLDTIVLLSAFSHPAPIISPENTQLALALLTRFNSESEVHARPALAVAVAFLGLSCQDDGQDWDFWTREARKKYWRTYSDLTRRRNDAAALFLLGLSRLLAHYSQLLLNHASIRTIAREIAHYMNAHSASQTDLTLYFLPDKPDRFDVRRHVRESVWEYLRDTEKHAPFTKSANNARERLKMAITLDGGEGFQYEKPQPFPRKNKGVISVNIQDSVHRPPNEPRGESYFSDVSDATA